MLEQAAHDAELVINPITYAEVPSQFDSIEELDEALPTTFCRRASLPWEAGYFATWRS
jgi:hypothetical protein